MTGRVLGFLEFDICDVSPLRKVLPEPVGVHVLGDAFDKQTGLTYRRISHLMSLVCGGTALLVLVHDVLPTCYQAALELRFQLEGTSQENQMERGPNFMGWLGLCAS
jgi:hypothetical protein